MHQKHFLFYRNCQVKKKNTDWLLFTKLLKANNPFSQIKAVFYSKQYKTVVHSWAVKMPQAADTVNKYEKILRKKKL